MAAPASVSVVIPAFHEEAAIGRVVAELPAGGPWKEVLVGDDG